MAESMLLRVLPNGHLLPDDPTSQEAVAEHRAGAVLAADVRRVQTNSYKFHKKLMALMRLAFDWWKWPEPMKYRGLEVELDFERFRGELLILAGHFKPVWNVRGEMKMEPKSLKFARMPAEEREKVYNDVLTVVVRHIGDRISREEIERCVEQAIVGFF